MYLVFSKYIYIINIYYKTFFFSEITFCFKKDVYVCVWERRGGGEEREGFSDLACLLPAALCNSQATIKI